MMDFDNTRLQLGLSLTLHDHQSTEDLCMKKKVENQQKCYNIKEYYPSLKLGPPEEDEASYHQQHGASKTDESSFSNSSSIKREIEQVLGAEVEIEKVPTRMGDVDEDGNPRKKLRLSKEQSAVLEENFREQSTLNPKQKQELAKKLNLQARQVEVWFQNRRARTKVKQTESHYEILKKSCQTLKEENKKLQEELQELKSTQTMPVPAAPFYVQIPAAATLSICPLCERIWGGNNNNNGGSSPMTTLLIGSKAHYHHHFHKNTKYYASPSPSPATC